MVDNVHISGSDLPQWATEKTLADLVKAIADLKNLSSSQTKKMETALAKVASASNSKNSEPNDEILKEIKGMVSIFASSAADRKKEQSINYDMKDNLGATAAAMTKTTASHQAMSAVLHLGQLGFYKMASVVGLNLKAFSSLHNAVMGFAAALIGTVANSIIQNMNMYTDLYKSGVLYNQVSGSVVHGLGALAKAAVDAGVPVQTMGVLLKKFSVVVNRLGIGNFGAAAKEVSAFASTFAMSNSDSAEYLAEYLDRQRIMGVLQEQSSQEIADGAKKQLKSTMDLARAMGVTVDQLREQQRASKDVDVTAALATLPKEISKKAGPFVDNMLAAFNEAGMSDVGKGFVQAISKGPLARGNEFFLSLNKLGPVGQNASDAIFDLAEKVRNGSVTQEDANAQFENIVTKMSGLDPQIAAFASQMEVVGAMTSGTVAMFQNANQVLQNMKKPRTKDEEETAKGMAEMNNSMELLKNTFTDMGASLFADQKFVKEFQDALKNVSKLFKENIVPWLRTELPVWVAKISAFVLELTNGATSVAKTINNVQGAFTSFLAGVSTIMSFSWFPALFSGAIATLVVGLKASIPGIITGVTTMFSGGIYSFIGGLHALLSPFVSIVSGLAPIGITLATVYGIFKGIYEGLMQFDTDQILLSVGNLFVRIGKNLVDIFLKFSEFLSKKLNFFDWMGTDQEISGKYDAMRSSWADYTASTIPVEEEKQKTQVGSQTGNTNTTNNVNNTNSVSKTVETVSKTTENQAVTQPSRYDSETLSKVAKINSEQVEIDRAALETLEQMKALMEKLVANTKTSNFHQQT